MNSIVSRKKREKIYRNFSVYVIFNRLRPSRKLMFRSIVPSHFDTDFGAIVHTPNTNTSLCRLSKEAFLLEIKRAFLGFSCGFP